MMAGRAYSIEEGICLQNAAGIRQAVDVILPLVSEHKNCRMNIRRFDTIAHI
ncbi:hypothetical protein J2TS6_52160 [Paenibacillus albilobatus]|uniref:Uncharacterized protein n=1 Tax=Paenibacillus albilobatus TaxID=2716884 RepID=A0A920CC18_9BACL|nr:hypothetical protein J2TS6_52160 [Paenibacillus albilobatus]